MAYLSKNTKKVEIEGGLLREENHQHQHEADEHWAVSEGKLEHLEGNRPGRKNYKIVREHF